MGDTVLINGVPHSVVVHTVRGKSVRTVGVLLDGSVYFSLANDGKRQYNKNKPVTDADLSAALLSDWGREESGGGESPEPAVPVTDETLASALMEDWGLTDDSRKTDPRYAGLTDPQKAEIKKQSGWSDGLVDFIRSADEARLYMKFDLQEYTINDRLCLIPRGLDMDQVDSEGMTNRQRMAEGKPPKGSDGKSYEVHHIGQQMDSPLAVLTHKQHHAKGIDAVLHNKKRATEIDRNIFRKEKKRLWKKLAGKHQKEGE